MNISGLGVDTLDGTCVWTPVLEPYSVCTCVVASYGLSPVECLGDSNHSVSPIRVDHHKRLL